jgi:pre-mRNA-splicing helicase BRR2
VCMLVSLPYRRVYASLVSDRMLWRGRVQDEVRARVLQLDDRQMADVARACNRYPNIELEFTMADDAPSAGEGTSVTITLEREEDSADVGPAIAPFYPQKKDEGWWLVLGDVASNTLLAIKVRPRRAPALAHTSLTQGATHAQRLTLQKRATVKLDFVPPKAGQFTYKLYFMCDAYAGCDQEYEVPVKVAPGAEEDDEAGAEADDGKGASMQTD